MVTKPEDRFWSISVLISFSRPASSRKILEPASCAALRALDSNGLQGSLPDGIRLTEVRPEWDRSSPYLVMHANANLIPSHSDIYSPSFVKLLLTYLSFYLEEKPDETPLVPAAP
jgi:hypothetical protein